MHFDPLSDIQAENTAAPRRKSTRNASGTLMQATSLRQHGREFGVGQASRRIAGTFLVG
jgi:hypothetical protein